MSPLLPSWLRRPSTSAKDTRFGYAVVGLGHGAGKMCEALRNSPHARVTAAVSSSLERAQPFARKWNIPHAYTYDQFDAIAANSAVDAVYLALPVQLHHRFTEMAATAGKHVLCEKPMAASLADAEAMIAACKAAGKLLMIAYRLDYDPMHAEVKRLLAEGALGQLQHITSSFGIVAKPGWSFDPAFAGGGSLFDVGVYPIHALHEFFGETTVTAARIIEDSATRMELDATWSGTLSNGATFECSSSYIRRIPDSFTMRGEHGTLTLMHAFDYSRTELQAEFNGKTLRLSDSKRNPSLFCLEAEHLAQCVREGMQLRSPGEGGLRDLKTVAQIEAVATRTQRE